MRTLLFVGVVLSAGLLAAQAPDPKKPDDTKPPTVAKSAGPAATEFDVTMADGSRFKVATLDPSVVLVSKYGTLNIPLTDLRRVEMGFRYPDGVEAKVEDAAMKLGSSSFREREEAERTMLDLKEFAIPTLRRSSKSTDPEVVRRAESVLKKLTDKLPEEKLTLKDYDTVVTTEFTIRGRLQATAMKVRTKYFGEVELKLAETRTMTVLSAAATAGELNLDAAKYARQGWTTWMDTEIDVSAELTLEITASGQIDQWIQGPGQYMSGPRGTGAAAPGFPGGAVGGAVPAMPGGRGGFAPAVLPGGQYSSGSVIGKIGQNGTPFVIGEGFKQPRAPATGRLYLIIAPSNWNNDSVGTYKVKVKSGE